MKKVINFWCSSSLIIKIVIGLVLGAAVGVAFPGASWVAIFGQVFVGMLKGIAPVLVFFLVSSALAKAGAGVASRFRIVIVLYIFSTFLAAIVAVAASFLFPITISLTDAVEQAAPTGIGEVLANLLVNLVQNPISSVANANYIGILFWAILLGICLKKVGRDSTIVVFEELSQSIAIMVKGIIYLAPIGIFGLVYASVAESGLSIFRDYGKLVIVLVGCMLTVALVVNPIIVAITLKRNPYPLVFRCLKESGITAFFTRSSAANIPVNMQLCEDLGLDKDFYSVCIPLGATINMDGAAITITIMSLAVCHTLGIAVDVPTAIILSIIATLGACGASGVAGGSLLLIPMACSLFGVGSDIAMQAVAVGFIIGVIQDSLETALNSSADALYTATAEYYERKKNGEDMQFLGKWGK